MANDTSSEDPSSPRQDHDAPPPTPGGDESVVRQLLQELRDQRHVMQADHAAAAAERRLERRWRIFFQCLFFAVPLVIGLVYFLFFLGSTGFRWGPFTEVVGVVHIDGQIAAGSGASADRIIASLEAAFTHAGTTAVVLSIDSPGGAPVESERVADALALLKKRYNKPVVAVINNIGTSAAYMIAMHADRIIAGKYSLVGSIGAIMAPWELDRAIAKLDITQRVYASGKLKAFLNPFTPVTPEVDAKAKKLVEQIGATFVRELKAARGAHLKPGIDYGSGEVWGGVEARELGLVDAIGTLDEVVSSTWGLDTFDFGPRPQGFGVIASSFQSAISALLEHVATQQGLQLRSP